MEGWAPLPLNSPFSFSLSSRSAARDLLQSPRPWTLRWLSIFRVPHPSRFWKGGRFCLCLVSVSVVIPSEARPILPRRRGTSLRFQPRGLAPAPEVRH